MVHNSLSAVARHFLALAGALFVGAALTPSDALSAVLVGGPVYAACLCFRLRAGLTGRRRWLALLAGVLSLLLVGAIMAGFRLMNLGPIEILLVAGVVLTAGGMLLAGRLLRASGSAGRSG